MTENISTVNDMNPLIGKIGDVAVADLRFIVRVVNVRQRYGRTDVQVEPLSGTGRTWKALDSIINLRTQTNPMGALEDTYSEEDREMYT